VLYVVVQWVLVFAFPGLGAPSDAPLAEAAVALSPALGLVVAIGALVSTLGFVSGSALGTPRYLFAMAKAGALPTALARLHPRFGSPHLAVMATTALAALLVLPFDYRTLIGMSNVAVAVQYGSTCLAVLRQTALAPVGPRRRLRLCVSFLGVLTSSLVFWAATWEELAFAAAALFVGMLVSAAVQLLGGKGLGRKGG
jgi:APA family basic amino acid/polyamine antiporter